MAKQIKVVVLDNQQKIRLANMLKKGRWSPRELKRVKILLTANDNPKLSNEELAKKLFCGRETARRVKNRFIDKGLDNALFEKPRSGQPKKLDDKDEAFIIATCCSEPPKGYGNWTLSLLQKRLKHRRKKEISTEPIRAVLLKNELKPWLKKNVVHS